MDNVPNRRDEVDSDQPSIVSRRYTDSSSFKMALLFTLLLGVSSGVLAFLINQFNTQTLIDQVEIGIDSDLAAFKDWQEIVPFLSIPKVIDRLKKNHTDSIYTYQNAWGEFVYGDLIPDNSAIRELEEGILLLRVDESSAGPAQENLKLRHRYAAKLYDLEDGARLLIARDIEEALAQRRKMQQLGLLTMLLMLLVIATSFMISTYVVGLTNRIGDTARGIVETGDFSQRIDLGSQWDDLSSLGAVLNDLLERTESSIRSVRQVSDNIAHDLRTPLTRLRNQLEDLDDYLGKTGEGESRLLAEKLTRECDQILGTFGALLRIARIESGKREQEFAPVSIKPLLEDILELYEPLAEEKGVAVEADLNEGYTYGDLDMLFQVFANLVDNAVKFSDEGGLISLRCGMDEKCVFVMVSDTGIGISDEDKKRIFNRFYRTEQSRNTPGNGLGLSLVQAVMTMHKAEIKVVDNNPGAKFIMMLPRFEQG